MGKRSVIIATFVLTLCLGACTPSASSVQTAIAQTESASSEAPTGCPRGVTPILWSEVHSGQSNAALCVYGKIFKIHHDSDGRPVISFSDTAQSFFIVITDSLRPFVFEQDCIVVYSRLRTNIQGAPYFLVNGESISSCPE